MADITLALKLGYNGAPFCGFARQPGQLTVQGELEDALKLLFRRQIDTTCAGRTDSGVHAREQVVSFDIDEEELRGRSFESLKRSLNALTHDCISISSVIQKDLGFSARFDAKFREYRYLIATQDAPPVFMEPYCWHLGSLDIHSMEEASKYLLGEKDFKSFCMAASAVGKRTYRNISFIGFDLESMMGEEMLVVTIKGNAFLHSMVRAIIGTLTMVGKGKRDPEWVSDVVAARDRKAAGENAPSKGLILWKVGY